MKVLTVLKHLFIPHDKNDYKPHFFREFSVAIVLFGSTFMLGASYGSSFLIHKTVLGASVVASVLVDLTNDNRMTYHEKPLIRNAKLDTAAQLKGEDMAKFGYFAHESPAGVTPWHWFKQAGYAFVYAGENLAINFTESSDIEKAWLDSPTHKANLLDVKFHEIGIATVEGTYENNPTIFVVQMFGTPAYADTGVPVSTTPVLQSAPLVPLSTTTAPTEATSSLKVIAKNDAKKIATTSVMLAQASSTQGEVKGEAIGVVQEDVTMLPIMTTKELAIVKNTGGSEVVLPETTAPRYSTWYGRMLLDWPQYVDTLFKALILVVAVALITMILVEVRKQHYKHILYGVCMLVVLTLFVFINKGFFFGFHVLG